MALHMKIKIFILLIIGLFMMVFALSAQTLVTITNSTNTIKLTYSDGSWVVVAKRGAKVINPVTGTIIYYVDSKKAQYSIDFINITSPVTANKDALAIVIKNYLN